MCLCDGRDDVCGTLLRLLAHECFDAADRIAAAGKTETDVAGDRKGADWKVRIARSNASYSRSRSTTKLARALLSGDVADQSPVLFRVENDAPTMETVDTVEVVE